MYDTHEVIASHYYHSQTPSVFPLTHVTPEVIHSIPSTSNAQCATHDERTISGPHLQCGNLRLHLLTDAVGCELHVLPQQLSQPPCSHTQETFPTIRTAFYSLRLPFHKFPRSTTFLRICNLALAKSYNTVSAQLKFPCAPFDIFSHGAIHPTMHNSLTIHLSVCPFHPTNDIWSQQPCPYHRLPLPSHHIPIPANPCSTTQHWATHGDNSRNAHLPRASG